MESQDKLMKDVRAKIEESLPAIQVDVFRKYVEESETKNKALDLLKDDYKRANVELAEAKSNLQDLRKLSYEADDIANQRSELEHNKEVFGITKALKDAKIASEIEKRMLVSDMFNQVFRNIEMRRNVIGDIPMREKYPDGSEYTTSVRSDTLESETKL